MTVNPAASVGSLAASPRGTVAAQVTSAQAGQSATPGLPTLTQPPGATSPTAAQQQEGWSITDRSKRELLDGVTIDRPLEIVPTILTNAVENMTGRRDERYGRAISELLLAGQLFIQAGLQHAAQGQGVVAAGSSVLSKVLPTVGIGLGAMQVWKGWNELQRHDEGPLSIIHSKDGRGGLIQVTASALMFVPGLGPLLGGAALRVGAAANEMDAFSFLDWPSTPIEQQGGTQARLLHPFDSTPQVAGDSPSAPAAGGSLTDSVGNWIRARLGTAETAR